MDIVHDKETGDDDQRRLLGRCGIPVKSGNGLLLPPPDDDQQNHNRNQKKQVRRRLHTSRPYQERLLNMAEARREIVAALKFHRATMKQSSSSSNRRQQQQQETNLHIPNNLPPPPQQQQPTSEEEMNQAYYSHHTQTSSGNSCGSINSCCSYFLQQQQQPNSGCSYLWPSSSSSSSSSSSQFGYSPFPFSTDVDILHDFPLPNQTLGLNLNFHQFANLETPVCRKFVSETNSPQWQAVVQDHEVKANPVVMMDHVKMNSMTPVYQESDEQKSGWWYKRFKSTMEPEQEPDCNYLFDETVNGVDVPYWLSSEEESCFHEIDHTISQDHLLPSMDIGEIETIDGDWLS